MMKVQNYLKRLRKENIGKRVAIFLDGAPISIPVVREAIAGGKAQISGTFTPEEKTTCRTSQFRSTSCTNRTCVYSDYRCITW